MKQEIAAFHEAIKNPRALTGSNKTDTGKILGYMCSYAPEELIYAAGFHPLRLFSSKADISLAQNHVQAYCCSLVRGVLEDHLAGRLDFLDGMVFPHTCDSIMRLSDILRINGKYEFFADVIMPAKLNTRSSRDYMIKVLKKFRSDLENAAGKKITESDLAESIALFNQIRTDLARIYELKSLYPTIIRGTDLFAIVKGAMIMDRTELARCLRIIVSCLEETDPPRDKKTDKKRIILSGSVCDMPDIYALIEDAGAVVVADDLCTGQRWFQGMIRQDLPPMEALGQRYCTRIVCPAKHSSITARGEMITKLAHQHRADGVIFLLVKFCDPHAFDYPYMKEYLDHANTKNQLIELDDQQQGTGQLSTRIETFVHMI